jgi:hypothetical protein
LPFCNKSLLEKWIATIGEQNIKISKFPTVCSKHFHESCFDKTGQTTRLYQDAYPTLFLGGNANEEIIELFIFVHFVPIAVHVSMYIEHAIPLCISLLYVVYVNV